MCMEKRRKNHYIDMAMYASHLQRRVTNPEDATWQNPNTGANECLKDIFKASIEGDVECLSANLAIGVDVNSRGQPQHIYGPRFQKCGVFHATPLHYACGYNREDAVKFLLQNGARLDILSACGMTPREYAKRRQYDKILAIIDDFCES